MKKIISNLFIIILLFGLVFYSNSILSQPQYVARYDGPGNGYDRGRLVALDALGNVYVTGESEDNVNSEGFDFATLKYDHYLQNQFWNQPYGNRYSGAAHGNDYPKAIAIDNNSGYLYVTGTTNEIGLFTDITTIAYDLNSGSIKNGFPIHLSNGLKNQAVSMALDAGGNIYVVGNIPEVQNSTIFHIGVIEPPLIL